MKTVRLAFSPCPNDTFMFDALVHGRVDTEGLLFDFVTADVEELNRSAFDEKFEVSKMSYHAYLYLSDRYVALSCGSAMGESVGPLLIGNQAYKYENIPSLRLAIPGKYTTAALLYQLYFPKPKDVKEVLFSDIERHLVEKEQEIGLIIHENRFTYQNKGLAKLADLGDLWTQERKLPIPLGGIMVNRKLDDALKSKIARSITRSIRYAFDNPKASQPFVRSLAQEMDLAVCEKHIALYVNEYSLNMGETGEKTVRILFEMAKERGLVDALGRDDLVFLSNQYSQE